jgi:ribosomal protein L31
MCTLASVNKSTTCNVAGSIKRVLVLTSSTLTDATFTLGTVANAFKVTAVTGTPPVYEVPFSKKLAAQASSVKNGKAYTHNVNVRIQSNEHPIFRDLDALQDCCGYVVVVKDSAGAWFLLGATIDRASNKLDIGEMDVTQADFDTDSTLAGEAQGFTVAFNSEQMNCLMIPVASAAVTTLEGLIVAATP